MRFLIIALILGLFIVIIGFMITNAGVVTDLTLWDRPMTDIPLYMVVIVSILVGLVTAGVAAVAEGTHIRLANRRLTRQVQKMETEINYLRTQPPVQRAHEPDDLPPTRSAPGKRDKAPDPPSAPVYGSGEDEDDDTYTGGRAV
jgi:uncharacterized integral membrane protein